MAESFNGYFAGIASEMAFNDPIADDYGKDNILISPIAKYVNHLSFIAIISGSGTMVFRANF